MKQKNKKLIKTDIISEGEGTPMSAKVHVSFKKLIATTKQKTLFEYFFIFISASLPVGNSLREMFSHNVLRKGFNKRVCRVKSSDSCGI